MPESGGPLWRPTAPKIFEVAPTGYPREFPKAIWRSTTCPDIAQGAEGAILCSPQKHPLKPLKACCIFHRPRNGAPRRPRKPPNDISPRPSWSTMPVGALVAPEGAPGASIWSPRALKCMQIEQKSYKIDEQIHFKRRSSYNELISKFIERHRILIGRFIRKRSS